MNQCSTELFNMNECGALLAKYLHYYELNQKCTGKCRSIKDRVGKLYLILMSYELDNDVTKV